MTNRDAPPSARQECYAHGREVASDATGVPLATTQLYEHHAPIQYVSEQLGHASIKITMDTYGHPRQGTNIALADRLDDPDRNALR